MSFRSLFTTVTPKIGILSGFIKVSKTLNVCTCKPRFLSSKPFNQINQVVNPETGEIKKKKSSIVPKITLIQDNELSVMTLVEAQKLSKRRDLKLVKIIDLDTKTQRPVYKLMTGSEYHEEDLKQRELRKKDKQNAFVKGEKVLILNHTISEHDLQTNINKISKWLKKFYEVRLIINGDSQNMEKAEKVFNFMEKVLSMEGRFLQKRQKGSDIKFQIMPPKKTNENDKNGL